MKSIRQSDGFSLVELVLVLSIITTISGFFFANYRVQSENQRLIQAVNQFTADISLLRNRTANTPDELIGCMVFEGYQVLIPSSNATTYVLSACCDGTCSQVLDSRSLPNNITFLDQANFIFLPNSVGTNLTREEIITIENRGINGCYEVTISPLGIINKNPECTAI